MLQHDVHEILHAGALRLSPQEMLGVTGEVEMLSQSEVASCTWSHIFALTIMDSKIFKAHFRQEVNGENLKQESETV